MRVFFSALAKRFENMSQSTQLLSSSDRIEIARRHIESARAYTKTLLEDLTDDEWFWTPEPPISHIAWQVGHLAFAEYGLGLFRQRDRQPVDAELMSGKFRKIFRKGTTPEADRSIYPKPSDILATLDRVHAQVIEEMPTFVGQQLDEKIDPPHAAFETRYGALLFLGDHEMLHAGQIGLLRRLMGKPPLR